MPNKNNAPQWSKWIDQGCKNTSTRVYTSDLINAGNQDRIEACMNTEYDILGDNTYKGYVTREKCIDGSNNFPLLQGRVEIPDSSCSPYWGKWKKEGCEFVDNTFKRRYQAQLYNVPSNMSTIIACKQTPINTDIKNKRTKNKYISHKECVKGNRGIYGQQGTIHLKDDSCKPRWAQWTKGNDCGALNLPCHISNMFVPQNKYYKAKLENYSTDDDPLVACMNTPVTSDVPISNKYLSQKQCEYAYDKDGGIFGKVYYNTADSVIKSIFAIIFLVILIIGMSLMVYCIMCANNASIKQYSFLNKKNGSSKAAEPKPYKNNASKSGGVVSEQIKNSEGNAVRVKSEQISEGANLPAPTPVPNVNTDSSETFWASGPFYVILVLTTIGVITLASLPKLLLTKHAVGGDSLTGACSGRYKKDQRLFIPTGKAFGHVLQGMFFVILFGLLPTISKERKKLKIILATAGLLLCIVYQIYNYKKRTSKKYKGIPFRDSSYFNNMFDFQVGTWFGLVITAIIFSAAKNNRLIVDKYMIICISIALLITLIFFFLTIAKMKDNTLCNAIKENKTGEASTNYCTKAEINCVCPEKYRKDTCDPSQSLLNTVQRFISGDTKNNSS